MEQLSVSLIPSKKIQLISHSGSELATHRIELVVDPERVSAGIYPNFENTELFQESRQAVAMKEAILQHIHELAVADPKDLMLCLHLQRVSPCGRDPVTMTLHGCLLDELCKFITAPIYIGLCFKSRDPNERTICVDMVVTRNGKLFLTDCPNGTDEGTYCLRRDECLPRDAFEGTPFEISISMSTAMDSLEFLGEDVQDSIMATVKMLSDGGTVDFDLELVASNGTRFLCSKAFMSAQSDILASMIEVIDQQPGTSRSSLLPGQIAMEGMSDAGVDSFLNFLYANDIGVPRGDVDVALELLKAGRRYGLLLLEARMEEILTEQDNSLYSVTQALQLFRFAKTGEGEEWAHLKAKAVEVLKSKPQELLTCDDYHRLFPDKSLAGIELLKDLFFMVLTN